jgi:hypothetical protein
MQEFLARIVGEQWAFPVLVALGLILALIILYVILRLFRGRGDGGTFVVGGRNRKPRLAVMDATAIDNYRRLVLVRRDDVEHLILIGGSADVVVERDIRAAGQVRRPQPPGETVAEQLGPAAPELAYAPQPRPIPARPPRPQTPVTEPHRAPQRPAPPPTVRPAPAQVRPAAPRRLRFDSRNCARRRRLRQAMRILTTICCASWKSSLTPMCPQPSRSLCR